MVDPVGAANAVGDWRDAARTLARLARFLDHSCTTMSLPQYRILAAIAAGDARASVVANRLTLAKPTVTAAVDALVDRGLLTRAPEHDDRRAARLRITTAGRRALATTEASMACRLAEVFARLDDPGRAHDAFEDLHRALDAMMLERLTGR